LRVRQVGSAHEFLSLVDCSLSYKSQTWMLEQKQPSLMGQGVNYATNVLVDLAMLVFYVFYLSLSLLSLSLSLPDQGPVS
jgi:hypothetical protein